MTSSQCHPMASSKPRVVVVGAGFAGVSAAAALIEGGIEDVVVLEAQDRPGGRVQKTSHEGGFLESGAQFIHGERGNHLYELAEEYGMLMDKSLYQGDKTSDSSAGDYKDHHFYTSRGCLVPQESAQRLLKSANHILRDYANSFFAETQDEKNEADEDADDVCHQNGYEENGGYKKDTHVTKLQQNGDETIHSDNMRNSMQKRPKKKNGYIIDYSGARLDNKEKEETTFRDVLVTSRQRLLATDCGQPDDLKLAFLGWMEQWEYTDNSARLEDCSLQAYGKYGYCPGYGLTLSSSGLADIFAAFLQKHIPAGVLHLNKPVATVYWNEQQGGTEEKNGLLQQCCDSDCERAVRVKCEDGEELWADYVVVTSSIGFIRRHQDTLFQPKLPTPQLEAVNHMGFGTVAKVFLVWDHVLEEGVLEKEVEGIQFLWMDDDSFTPPSDRSARKTKRGGNWYDNLQGFERVESHKGALLTWLAGEEADIMEQLPEDEIRDVMYEILVQFTNRPDLPRPKYAVRSQWHSNPYILGGYSYISATMDPKTHNLLSQPLPSSQNPVLQLAGEATSCRFYSTAHGAIDSGQRAARHILRHHSMTA